ncbi:MAG: rhomboid family intramembrane serine protease [Lentisphaerae bacterium]|nr:rhomboid family intramembrane serine protease [Lentisphaerota bacterium]
MGLYDRNYMYNRENPEPESGRKMLITLIIINVIAFFIARPGTVLYDNLALNIGSRGFHAEYIWQFVTAGFLHSGFGHIFFNMWGLYIFGSLVAPRLSGSKMLILYLAGSICGNVLFYCCNMASFFPVQLVGASGAVCAFMTAGATVEPNRRFMIIFLPFTPIKTTTLVIVYTAMEILFELTGRNSNVAHLAHLGGFLAGYLVMRCYFGRRLPWDPLRSFFNKPRQTSGSQTPPPPEPPKTDHRTDDGGKVTQRELDALLDKLSTSGINSLSEYELSRLRRARRQMRGEE